MRIRSTKPEFWRSKTIASVSWDARLVLKALESYVDDNGVGKDDMELIVMQTFSRDQFRNPTGTVRRVSEAVSELSQAGLVTRYDYDGENLIYVERFKEHQYVQKPQRGRFRRPDGTLEYSEDVNPEAYRNAPEVSGSSPAWIRGTGDQGISLSCASADAERDSDHLQADFDEWYAAYPRKKGKGQAMKAYRAARKKTDAQTLLTAVEQQAPTLTAKGTEFCPYPATWLNGERWADEDPAHDNVTHLPDGRVQLPPLPKGYFDQ